MNFRENVLLFVMVFVLSIHGASSVASSEQDSVISLEERPYSDDAVNFLKRSHISNHSEAAKNPKKISINRDINVLNVQNVKTSEHVVISQLANATLKHIVPKHHGFGNKKSINSLRTTNKKKPVFKRPLARSAKSQDVPPTFTVAPPPAVPLPPAPVLTTVPVAPVTNPLPTVPIAPTIITNPILPPQPTVLLTTLLPVPPTPITNPPIAPPPTTTVLYSNITTTQTTNMVVTTNIQPTPNSTISTQPLTTTLLPNVNQTTTRGQTIAPQTTQTTAFSSQPTITIKPNITVPLVSTTTENTSQPPNGQSTIPQVIITSTAGVQPTLTVTSTTQPGTTAQSGSSVQPVTTVQSGTTAQSGSSVQPVTTVQSVTTAQPGTSVQPGTSTQPGYSVQPGTTAQTGTSVPSGTSAQYETSTQILSTTRLPYTTQLSSTEKLRSTTRSIHQASVSYTKTVPTTSQAQFTMSRLTTTRALIHKGTSISTTLQHPYSSGLPTVTPILPAITSPLTTNPKQSSSQTNNIFTTIKTYTTHSPKMPQSKPVNPTTNISPKIHTRPGSSGGPGKHPGFFPGAQNPPSKPFQGYYPNQATGSFQPQSGNVALPPGNWPSKLHSQGKLPYQPMLPSSYAPANSPGYIPSANQPVNLPTQEVKNVTSLSDCPAAVESMGCYFRPRKVFQKLLLQKNKNQSLEEFFCECGNLVEKRHWTMFMLTNGNCFSTPQKGAFDKAGVSKDCVNDSGDECTDADTYCQGLAGSMNVYSILNAKRHLIPQNSF